MLKRKEKVNFSSVRPIVEGNLDCDLPPHTKDLSFCSVELKLVRKVSTKLIYWIYNDKGQGKD